MNTNSNKYIEQLVKMAEEGAAPNILGYAVAPAIGGAALGGLSGYALADAIGKRDQAEIARDQIASSNPKIEKYWEREAELNRGIAKARKSRWAKRGAIGSAVTLGGLGAAEYLWKKRNQSKTTN